MITKSYPRLAKKQYHVHNLPKSKSCTTTLGQSMHTISSREHKKGIPSARSEMTPDHRNPLKQGFFSLPLCNSCHQYYGLDVARLLQIDVRF